MRRVSHFFSQIHIFKSQKTFWGISDLSKIYEILHFGIGETILSLICQIDKSQISMLQDIRRQGLGKSGLKFRHGRGGVKS